MGKVHPGDGAATDAERRVEQVRERYGKIGAGEVSGCCGPANTCCGPSELDVSQLVGYGADELAAVPAEANLGVGCGAPIGALALRPGETVVDLGSGGGLDAFLAARQVGPDGHVIGVDMTPEMLARARQAAAQAGFTQVEFREGRLERLPVDDASVDAVTSNCVINLVPDKAAVFCEVARVLRPGGRLVVSDIVLDGELPAALRESVDAYVGCVAGAVQRPEYLAALEGAGLTDVEVLRDVDYLATLGESLPPELLAAGERAGVRPKDVVGKVRSLTYRAWRR